MIAMERAPTDARVSSHGHVVLCVDDEFETLKALRRAFRHEPFDLLTTADPDEALRWVGDRDVSLVISDQRMPAMSGTQVLKGVRERSPTTIGVILTAYPGTLLAPGRPWFGIRELVLKPWDDEDLKNVVRQLLRERESAPLPPEADDGQDLGGEGGHP